MNFMQLPTRFFSSEQEIAALLRVAQSGETTTFEDLEHIGDVQPSANNLRQAQWLHRNRWGAIVFDGAENLKPKNQPWLTLWYRGNLQLLTLPALAIVGSRTPDEHGTRAARAYAYEIVNNDEYVIVSGNAEGIDAAAHNAALEADGSTIAFVGTPPEATILRFTEDPDRTLVLTPFAPGHAVAPWNFLYRNRILAHYCKAALIAQTASKGGTLDTLKHLREFQRPTFAIDLPEESSCALFHQTLKISSVQELLPPTPTAATIQTIKHAMQQEPAATTLPPATTQPDLF